jgi:type IV pilus assembly protein PilN
MIKINLLLTRKEKKKVGMRNEVIVLILSGVVLVTIFAVLQWRLDRQRDDLLARIASTKTEIAHYKSVITDLNKAKELQKTCQTKLNVINGLRKEKGSPARVLDEISMGKPEKVHIESLKKDGTKLGIEGLALDDETVANFMTNLRKSKFFKSVDLVVTEQVEMSKLKLKKFILSCEILLL